MINRTFGFLEQLGLGVLFVKSIVLVAFKKHISMEAISIQVLKITLYLLKRSIITKMYRPKHLHVYPLNISA